MDVYSWENHGTKWRIFQPATFDDRFWQGTLGTLGTLPINALDNLVLFEDMENSQNWCPHGWTSHWRQLVLPQESPFKVGHLPCKNILRTYPFFIENWSVLCYPQMYIYIYRIYTHYYCVNY